jgi:hypothetical protein
MRQTQDVSQILHKRFDEKVCHVMEQHHRGDDCHSSHGNKCYSHDYKWQDCGDSGHHNNYNKCKKKQENRTPSDCGNKAFKPCLVHGLKSKHMLEECYKNPKNDKRQVQDKNVIMGRITTTHTIQLTTASCALTPIHWSQVRTWRQPPARAKNS